MRLPSMAKRQRECRSLKTNRLSGFIVAMKTESRFGLIRRVNIGTQRHQLDRLSDVLNAACRLRNRCLRGLGRYTDSAG